jgi:hypothetical protein
MPPPTVNGGASSAAIGWCSKSMQCSLAQCLSWAREPGVDAYSDGADLQRSVEDVVVEEGVSAEVPVAVVGRSRVVDLAGAQGLPGLQRKTAVLPADLVFPLAGGGR